MEQEYAWRRQRTEPFWEDRYHAVAVQTGEHLVRCMIYLDLNMVRVGEVSHPEDWPHSGYGEIVYPPIRYTLIDRKLLARLLFMKDESELSGFYRSWIEEGLSHPPAGRDPAWTEHSAVGNQRFVEDVRGELSSRTIARKLGAGGDDMFAILESLGHHGEGAGPGDVIQPSSNAGQESTAPLPEAAGQEIAAPLFGNTVPWDLPC
jgi:putative transposase